MFSCSFCGKTFKSHDNLNSHVLSHTKEKPHKCLICAAAFGIKSNLKGHIKSVHNGIKEIKKRNTHCPLCSYTCCSKTELEKHLPKHSTEQPFTCDIPGCGFKTKYKNVLVRHVRGVHCDVRPHECPSDRCNYKAKTRECLRRHFNTHSTEKPFACLVAGCNYACKGKAALEFHISRAHSDSKTFECSTCNFRTKTKRDLTRHKYKHQKVQRFRCQAPNCDYGTSEKCTLRRHLDRKHRKKYVPCTVSGCDFRCGSVALLKTHLKRHELSILKCPIRECNFSSTFKYNLLTHIAHRHEDLQSASVVEPRKCVRTTPAMVQTFHCRFPNCGYKTLLPQRFNHHTKTHKKGEKRRHVCSFCFSRFSHLCDLKSHVQRHTGEKPYSCSFCWYTTISGVGLKLHAANIHHIHVNPRGKEDEMRKCRTCCRNCPCYSELVVHSMAHLQAVVVLEKIKLKTS